MHSSQNRSLLRRPPPVDLQRRPPPEDHQPHRRTRHPPQHQLNSNNSAVPTFNKDGRPLSYNEAEHRKRPQIVIDYPMSDTETQRHVTAAHQQPISDERLLMPPPPPPIRRDNKTPGDVIPSKRRPPPIPSDHKAVQRRSYAGRPGSRSSSPVRFRHSYAAGDEHSSRRIAASLSDTLHTRVSSLSDNELLNFALGADDLVLKGTKRLSQASQSGSKRSSYVGPAGAGSKRSSLASATASAAERRRVRGISMSDAELEGLISELNVYSASLTSGSQRNSWVGGGSQRSSYAERRDLAAHPHHSRGASMDSMAGSDVGFISSSKVPEFHRYFIQPMNLCDPEEDLLGYTQLCSINIDDLDDMITSKLNQPVRMRDGRVLPAFQIRLWSRASGRYLSVLDVGRAVYARAEFEKQCHLRLLLMSKNRVCLVSNHNPQQFIQIRRSVVDAKGSGGAECEMLLCQNSAGYFTLESAEHRGSFLGVRENGNVMPATKVFPEEMSAQFILQKQSLDVYEQAAAASSTHVRSHSNAAYY